MTPCRALVFFVVAVVLSLLAGSAAWAGPPTDQLRVQIEKVLKVFADPELTKDGRIQERRVAIRKIASDIFDFNEITKRSLGRHWQARTPAEQAEFVGLLADLLERTYISKIEGYTGEKVAFVGEALDSGVATVRTKIVTKQGTEIPVDYRMYQAGDRWLAYDVSVEGISLIANYRTQFNAVIQKNSYQELVKTMKAKQGEAPEPVVAKRREPEPTGAAARAEEPAPVRRQSP